MMGPPFFSSAHGGLRWVATDRNRRMISGIRRPRSKVSPDRENHVFQTTEEREGKIRRGCVCAINPLPRGESGIFTLDSGILAAMSKGGCIICRLNGARRFQASSNTSNILDDEMVCVCVCVCFYLTAVVMTRWYVVAVGYN
jgi:hypothetical protein